jgi:hypothetical protein
MGKLVFLGCGIPVKANKVLFNKDVQIGITGIEGGLETDF